MTRRDQIILLIGWRFVYGPSISGARYGDVRGPAADTWTQCPTCNGDGWLADRFKRKSPCGTCSQPCPRCDGLEDARGCRRCHGHGRVWPRGHRGQIHVDSHTGLQVGSSESGLATKSTATRRCDRCDGSGVWKHRRCQLCDGSGRRPITQPLVLAEASEGSASVDQLDMWLDGIQRRQQAGSFEELDVALAGIAHHVNKPPEYQPLTENPTLAKRLLDDVYLWRTRDFDQLSSTEASLVNLALAYIDSRMPDPIRVPPAAIQNRKLRDRQLQAVKGRGAAPQAHAVRDKEIRRLVLAEGRPSQWVAQRFGLSVARVNSIVKGEVAA